MAKFKGPCIDCGECKDQQYTHKRCVACYQKFHRYNPEFETRKRYDGPCIYCGSYVSTEGRFIKKMCSTCYSRFKKNGGNAEYKEIIKYPGPCVKCGSPDAGYQKYFQEKMCGKCYRNYIHIKAHPRKPAYCIDCGKLIKTKIRNATRQRCTNCYKRWKWKTDPNFVKKIKASAKRHNSTENGKEARRNSVRKRRAILAKVETTLTKEQWKTILNHFGHKCVYCGSAKRIEMDHVIPISKGGKHIAGNVVPACRSCNSSKGNRLPPKPIQPLML